jgi:hypothetical protein
VEQNFLKSVSPTFIKNIGPNIFPTCFGQHFQNIFENIDQYFWKCSNIFCQHFFLRLLPPTAAPSPLRGRPVGACLVSPPAGAGTQGPRRRISRGRRRGSGWRTHVGLAPQKQWEEAVVFRFGVDL